MLDELSVRDYALIRSANLTFSPGCTVLSGETGAGKTALIGAIKLLIGERGDAGAVREGAGELRVEARFLIERGAGEAHGAGAGAAGSAEAPVGAGEAEGAGAAPSVGAGALTHGATADERIVARRLSTDGRSRCTLDGEMVTVNSLAQSIGPLVDLHGQHDHQALLAPAAQLALLDRAAGACGSEALRAWREAWEAHQEALHSVRELEASAQSSEQALEAARFALREIEAVQPLEGEFEELEARLPILRNGEALATASAEALVCLREEGGALERLFEAQRLLERQGGTDARLDGLSAQLAQVAIGADDLANSLRAYRDGVEFDADALQRALDRLGQLEGLCRRFGPRMEDVFVTWNDAARQLELVGNAAERREAAERECARTEAELLAAAARLSQIRAETAQNLAASLTASLQELAMSGTALSFSIQELPRESWSSRGPARYEILYRPTPSGGARPLSRIASGGELSRVMLAIKSLEHEATERATLIFDEIDAGIGGATATVVAQRLHSLAKDHQVIVVTHLAQIAAIAGTHLLVEKRNEEGIVETTIREVRGEERVAEIARMLAGGTDKTALEHARRLLAGA
ncbi:MAG: DNA repair protein RecN [Coriobacteriales bacterium]|jgi:DNA repair protein RecN (Recombination protein N)|nr:DNA repair protein RecN [Coriobacteriales bacterium]